MQSSTKTLKRRDLVLASAGLGLSLPGLAVESGLPSKTSILTAASRAIASRDPNPQTRCPDSIAEKFVQREDLDLLVGSNIAAMWDLRWEEVLRRETAAGRYPYISQTLRTMHIDSKVRTAVAEGIDELIILGAGLDSRAYRMTKELAKTRVLSYTFPPTQEYKKRRVNAALGTVPPNVTYVGIDFAKQTLDEVLSAAGHRASAKALFLMEGVMVYIPADAVTSTLRFVSRNSAPGGGIVFDYFDRRLLDGEGQTPLYKANAQLFRSWGEPQTFGIWGYASRGFAQEHGLRMQSDYTLESFACFTRPVSTPLHWTIGVCTIGLLTPSFEGGFFSRHERQNGSAKHSCVRRPVFFEHNAQFPFISEGGCTCGGVPGPRGYVHGNAAALRPRVRVAT